jgi:uncharacterized circularly permuted ATP-grasp superfamily protein
LVFAARATRDEAWLARAIDRYHELCAQVALGGPAVVKAFAEAQRRNDLTYGGRVLCRSLRPALIPPQALHELKIAVRDFWNVIRIIEQRTLRDPSLAIQLGLSEQERDLIAIDPGYDDATVVSRLDTFYDRQPAVIEYNADSPAGISYQAGQVELMRSLPVFQRFAAEYRLEYLAAEAVLRETLLGVWQEFSSRKGLALRSPVVAILDLAGSATSTEFALVERDLSAHGISTVIATPEDLTYRDGALLAGGRPVDLVYKRLLVADFLARYDLRHPLIRAYSEGAVCVASSFRCTIAHKKRALAMLSEPSHASWFSKEQLAAVLRFVAPTWPFAAFDRATLENERDDYVLKPNDAHGGESVYLGWECDEGQWRKALEDAAGRDYVVQRRVEVSHGTYPAFDAQSPQRGTKLVTFIEDRNAYVFRGKLGGLLTRLSESAIINVSQGGQAIPTFVIYPN